MEDVARLLKVTLEDVTMEAATEPEDVVELL
jgi:hypothetical protein